MQLHSSTSVNGETITTSFTSGDDMASAETNNPNMEDISVSTLPHITSKQAVQTISSVIYENENISKKRHVSDKQFQTDDSVKTSVANDALGYYTWSSGSNPLQRLRRITSRSIDIETASSLAEITSQSEPEEEVECRPDVLRHRLNVIGLTYIVSPYEGPWWRGCCLRTRSVKPVLQNVNMQFRSGQVTAIIGSSGAGKSSLLDCIALRSSGQVLGSCFLDSQLMTRDLFMRECGYVVRADYLLPHLTVRETLTYTARLKFGQATSDDIDKRVNKVLSEMGLRHVAGTRIGAKVRRSISGGERKRVSIALQLLQDPKVLLLDEPTTGLDSYTARYLVSNIVQLAKTHNKVVVMSVQQPRSDIYEMFDQIALLSSGQVLYLGPASQIVPYFTRLGYPCPEYTNPPDHYIDLASVDTRDPVLQEACVRRIEHLKDSYVRATMFRDTLADIHRKTILSTYSKESMKDIQELFTSTPGFFSTLLTLWIRMNKNLSRDPASLLVRCFQTCVFAIFMWLFVFRLKDNQDGIQDRLGLLYQMVQVPSACGIIIAYSLFPSMRQLYDRESRDGLYGSSAFIIAYALHALPFQIISGVAFASIAHWSMGMYPEFGRFATNTFVVTTSVISGEYWFLLAMAIFESASVANSCMVLVQAVAGMVSTGFLRNISTMIPLIRYFTWALIFKYSSEILVVMEFWGLKIKCDKNSTTPCLVADGEDIIEARWPGAIDNVNRNIGASVGFIFLYFTMTLIAFKIRYIRQLR